jgi:hypothetical protein
MRVKSKERREMGNKKEGENDYGYVYVSKAPSIGN